MKRLEGWNSILYDALTLQADVVFSIHPFEGFSILYDADTSDDSMIDGFGVSAASQIRVSGGTVKHDLI